MQGSSPLARDPTRYSFICNALVLIFHANTKQNGDGQQNPPSTSAGRSKLVRVRAHEETPTIREPPPSEQSTFSSSLVHSLQASFETTSVEDEVVDKVVYESGPPPKRSRKSRAVAQPAHKCMFSDSLIVSRNNTVQLVHSQRRSIAW